MMALLLLHWTTTTTPIVLIIGTAFELNKTGRQITYDQLENGIFTKLNTHSGCDVFYHKMRIHSAQHIAVLHFQQHLDYVCSFSFRSLVRTTRIFMQLSL
jgi:hypothetical protein